VAPMSSPPRSGRPPSKVSVADDSVLYHLSLLVLPTGRMRSSTRPDGLYEVIAPRSGSLPEQHDTMPFGGFLLRPRDRSTARWSRFEGSCPLAETHLGVGTEIPDQDPADAIMSISEEEPLHGGARA
jgi:hypothetical protein